MKGLSILGSTGSIGVSTLDVVRRHPERFRVVSLAAGSNLSLLREQVKEFKPDFISVASKDSAAELSGELHYEVAFGEEGASRAAAYDGVDICLSAISGAAGLVPTLSAIRAGKRIALANKETLVIAGAIVMEEAKKAGVTILPVDSEHSAVFQALSGHRPEDVKRIILTASGGPFLNRSTEELTRVTPTEALKHPNWEMGRRITIDSATMLNKGLEVIEARWLFDLEPEKINVTVHPQSIVHSMVEFVDASIVAQMGTPDMRGPIAYALSYPERIENGSKALDLTQKSLDFFEADREKFPCLALAYRALEPGEGASTMPAVLNAADEVAVAAFLDSRLGFTSIARVIEAVMDSHELILSPTLSEVLEADRWARERAAALIEEALLPG